jgi:hypothetical protein
LGTNLQKATFLSVGTFLFFGLQEITSWFIVTLSGIRGRPYFIDLRAVLKSSDCAKNIDWDIYDPSLAEGCSYIYGSTLIRILHIFQLDESDTYFIGWILLALFSVFIGTTLAVLKPTFRWQWLITIIVLFSPPTMLLLERANVDILVVLLVSLAAFSLARNKHIYLYITILIASLSKFYTAPLFLWLAMISKSILLRILSVSLFFVSSILIVSDLSRMKGDFPRNAWASFGNPIFGIYFHKIGIDFPDRIQDLIGFSILILTYFAMNLASKVRIIRMPQMNFRHVNNSYIDSLAQLFGLVFLLCYFASASYDYRLVFLFIPALYLISAKDIDKKTRFFLIASLIGTSWFSYASGYFQILGDLAILPWVVIFTRSALIALVPQFKFSRKS